MTDEKELGLAAFQQADGDKTLIDALCLADDGEKLFWAMYIFSEWSRPLDRGLTAILGSIFERTEVLQDLTQPFYMRGRTRHVAAPMEASLRDELDMRGVHEVLAQVLLDGIVRFYQLDRVALARSAPRVDADIRMVVGRILFRYGVGRQLSDEEFFEILGLNAESEKRAGWEFRLWWWFLEKYHPAFFQFLRQELVSMPWIGTESFKMIKYLAVHTVLEDEHDKGANEVIRRANVFYVGPLSRAERDAAVERGRQLFLSEEQALFAAMAA